MFAGTAQVVGTVLTVTGTSAGETIEVYEENGQNHDVIKVRFDGGTPFNFLDNQFTSIKVSAGGGNDTIVFGNTNNPFVATGDEPVKFAAVIYGEAGDDSVTATDNNDVVYGGYGYDLLDGYSGNDTMFGGNGSGVGDDTAGGDTLNGWNGNDSLMGEGGADSIWGGEGADYMYGGDGDDTLDAREFTSAIDTLDGGNGTDCGWWTTGVDSATNMEGNFML